MNREGGREGRVVNTIHKRETRIMEEREEKEAKYDGK